MSVKITPNSAAPTVMLHHVDRERWPTKTLPITATIASRKNRIATIHHPGMALPSLSLVRLRPATCGREAASVFRGTGTLALRGGIGRRLSLLQGRRDFASAQEHFVEIALQCRVSGGEAGAARGRNPRPVQHGEEGGDVDALFSPVVEVNPLGRE